MNALVVIGASQGGVAALRKLVCELPTDFPAPIVVVLHVGRAQSMLPSILNDLGRLRASHIDDGEMLRPGHIHVAPPDRHVLVRDGSLILTRGPRENWARPAIDPLFRTAAEAYDGGTIGVILTGLLNDGAAGLFEIKRRGGVAIVQDPAEAESPSMPKSALENVAVDFTLPVTGIAQRLTSLVKKRLKGAAFKSTTDIAMETTEQKFETPTAQTCPECGGAMREEGFGSLKAYRCHIGHRMSAEVLAHAQLNSIDVHLDTVLRMLNERTDLCRELAKKRGDQQLEAERRQWLAAADQAVEREAAIRKLSESSWLNPETALGTSDPA